MPDTVLRSDPIFFMCRNRTDPSSSDYSSWLVADNDRLSADSRRFLRDAAESNRSNQSINVLMDDSTDLYYMSDEDEFYQDMFDDDRKLPLTLYFLVFSVLC